MKKKIKYKTQVLNGIWYYFLIKLLDLLDTIFFVLRKKQNQITILHVYHHAGMVLLVWISLKFVQGGQATFLGYINGIVHIIMYSYYLIASLKLGKIWWKKYVTQLQILQFTLLALQHTLTILTPNCGFPKIISTLFLPHNFLMMLLFIRFYRNTYLKKNKKSTEIYANNVSNKIDENNVESSNGKIKTR
ncbi:PREDICTED: elongation of very long chain fatty acids protein 4-like [Polistes dominula]|uniref:Elongation of very long chain fatty acids protein n=1 Tax=Polistes dominula TaxID=743375 RepID=A0ABM1IYE7_POLDO|nr:PREDICTED: elongation of very long chain fatty acids protein 4-like [Polistes dominula]